MVIRLQGGYAGVWLFTRGSGSVRVNRSTEHPFELVVHGPGQLRRIYTFANELALREFQSELELQLVNTGWVLEEFTLDRRSGRDRRGEVRGGERRSQ